MFAGLTLVFFMMKPLFARRRQQFYSLTIHRGEEPLLYEFVDRLCDAVHSPRPFRIDLDTQMNASASFKEGWLGFLGRRLVLTIGLPLVAGLNL